MLQNELTVVSRHINAFEAHALRNRLENHGIPAMVEGADTHTMLSHIGPALGGVKVLVPNDRREEALAILQNEASGDASPIPEWTCQRCYSQVPAGFEVCWNCATPIPQADGDDARPASNTATQTTATESAAPHRLRPDAWDAAPASGRSGAPDREAQQQAIVESAWRSAVIGFYLAPAIAHLYSLGVLACHAPLLVDLQSCLRRKLLWTLVLDSTVLIVGAAMAWVLL